jgi:hypothetical protein
LARYGNGQSARERLVLGADSHRLLFVEDGDATRVRHAPNGIEERQVPAQARESARQVTANECFDMAYAKFAHCHIRAVSLRGFAGANRPVTHALAVQSGVKCDGDSRP